MSVARLTADLFERLVDRDGPGGLAAIVRSRTGGLPTLAVRPGTVFVALRRITGSCAAPAPAREDQARRPVRSAR